MTPYQKRMNPFIKRMAQDMQLRNYSPNTIDSYTFHVDKFCTYFNKPAVTPHTLRHSWATGMLEAGVDLLTISKLLGHSSFITTMIYLHVRRQHFDRSPSPLDWLPVRQCPQWAEPAKPDSEQATKETTGSPDGASHLESTT